MEINYFTTRQRSARVKMSREFNEILLGHFNGACVLVDEECTIIEAIGAFRGYASLPGNGFSTNLLELLEPELKHLVQHALKKARELEKKVYCKEAVFEHQGEKKGVDVLVKPFPDPGQEERDFYAITFIERELILDDVAEVEQVSLSSRTEEYMASLEEELERTREELAYSLEEKEARILELEAANEKLERENEEINALNTKNLQEIEDLSALNSDTNNLLESTQIGTIFLDEDLLIRKFTPAIIAHFSFLNTDVGRPISHFTDDIGMNNLVDRCKKVLATGKSLEKAVESKNGNHYLRRLSPYLDVNKQVKGVVITFIDIELLSRSREQLQSSERRYRSFYEEDPMMHISVDPRDAVIIACNKMAVTQLGYGSKEELIGKPLLELYGEEAQVAAIKNVKQFQQEGFLVNLEQSLVTRDGKIIPVILNARMEHDESNEIHAYRYTFADISALKAAEKELQRQKNDLERANRDLEQFVSICSHDLQEPLSTIKFGVDVLGKMYVDRLDQRGKNYISYIKEASTRLSNQIKALLEHSRIGRNGKRKKVNTAELVEIVMYDLGKSINDRNAKIHCGDLPVINGYEVELRLLFQNLISNAIKYTSDDRDPEVRISAYKEGDFWIFSVVDNGIGISREDQETIFHIFNRVDREHNKDGTGVGLAHVEKIVHLHEGKIWIDSQIGVGSSFFFKIKSS